MQFDLKVLHWDIFINEDHSNERMYLDLKNMGK